jgi:PII-like signaling protein
MALPYKVIEIFTSEEIRWKGKPVHAGVIDHVRKARIAARCLVSKGVAGMLRKRRDCQQ